MGGEAGGTNLPIPIADLTEIATDVCAHSNDWLYKYLSLTIHSLLQSLIEATTPDHPDDDAETDNPQPPPYRFNVNCTIIQQGVTAPDTPESREKVGKRGMHSASGAYWDVSRDGMWTFKYPNAEDKGLDLVLNIVWFGAN
ncbi:dynein light chain [Histoplasma capsulatum H143]|uniref:Dynein light chain n=1 Tax=Ajellomyces capsulatus (strain H143) TaxID=544712 RepID=C6H2E7_AJECH|nr:dynein light chain [Histoplasma capsulatum H143]